MKALFVHDHRFIQADGQIWSESQFEAALWGRYLKHFESLTVVGRRGRIPSGKSVSQLELSSAPFVTFELFPDLSNLVGLTVGRPAAFSRMNALVDRHEAVIARLPSELGLLAIQSARALGKPWAVEVVGCTWDALWNYGSIAGKAYAPFALWRMRRAVASAKHALYVTKAYLQKVYPTNANVVAAASNVNLAGVSDVSVGAICKSYVHKRLHRIDTLGQRQLKIGLIGTLNGRYKGIQTALLALGQARKEMPPLKFHILGGGDPTPWESEADRLGLSELVVFEGVLPAGSAVNEWLESIDLYLQPSLQEGLPRALIEAMSRACPALASTTGGIPELLAPEDMFRPGEAADLATLLIQRSKDVDWMRHRAIRNFFEASSYAPEVLEERRALFWKRFSDDAVL